MDERMKNLLEQIRKCDEFDTCEKINSLRDWDMLDFQFREGVIKTCRECIIENRKRDNARDTDKA